MKSAGYFRRFVEDFSFCIHDKFDQIYATSEKFSWTNAVEFVEFCKAAGIRCEEVSAAKYFNPGMCDGAFLTEEYTYDAKILGAYYQEQLEKQKNIEMQYCARIDRITKTEKSFVIRLEDGDVYKRQALPPVKPFLPLLHR